MSDKKAPKFLKAGKVVLLLNGRQAGKKAVILAFGQSGYLVWSRLTNYSN